MKKYKEPHEKTKMKTIKEKNEFVKKKKLDAAQSLSNYGRNAKFGPFLTIGEITSAKSKVNCMV